MKNFIKVSLMVFSLLTVGVLYTNCSNKNSSPTPDTQRIQNTEPRSFQMGFTTWPYDDTLESVQDMYSKVSGHGDLIAQHIDVGVPWAEALNNSTFPKDLNDDWNFRKSNTQVGKDVFLSITPLDLSRTKIAQAWTANGAASPQAPWNSYRLNHVNVKTAYLNYAKRAIQFFLPKYLVIGIESNLMMANNKAGWGALSLA